jgi:AraC-like DNA-binding protein
VAHVVEETERDLAALGAAELTFAVATSYQQLLSEARRARAEALLANRMLAVHEVAFALSYDDVSAFTRAFRHWTGTSPRAFRETVGSAVRAKRP